MRKCAEIIKWRWTELPERLSGREVHPLLELEPAVLHRQRAGDDGCCKRRAGAWRHRQYERELVARSEVLCRHPARQRAHQLPSHAAASSHPRSYMESVRRDLGDAHGGLPLDRDAAAVDAPRRWIELYVGGVHRAG